MNCLYNIYVKMHERIFRVYLSNDYNLLLCLTNFTDLSKVIKDKLILIIRKKVFLV